MQEGDGVWEYSVSRTSHDSAELRVDDRGFEHNFSCPGALRFAVVSVCAVVVLPYLLVLTSMRVPGTV